MLTLLCHIFLKEVKNIFPKTHNQTLSTHHHIVSIITEVGFTWW